MNRVLLDQGLPRGAVALLKSAGWHVVHTGDIGLSQATDRQIVEYAREKGALVTVDERSIRVRSIPIHAK